MYSSELAQLAATRKHFPFVLIVALVSLWAFPAIAAPKTDIVTFKNGDKLTGEVKSLKRGRLSLGTDAIGTSSIEWAEIESIVSDQAIQVETSSGVRYFGNLVASEKYPGLVVVTDDGPQILDFERVIVMSPIEGGGINALNVDLSVGYNFAKAGGVETGNFGLAADYRSLQRIESMQLSTTVTNSDTQEESKRANLAFQHTRLWRNRWFSNGSLVLDQNDELGLNLRTSIGGGGGRFFVQSNTMLLSLEAGLQVSVEDLVTTTEDTESVEATFTFTWDWFLFDDPELDWSTTFQIIPSLTESGRVRSEINTALKWEIIGDLKWGVSFYGTADNQPQDQTGAGSDYGVNTSVTYEF